MAALMAVVGGLRWGEVNDGQSLNLNLDQLSLSDQMLLSRVKDGKLVVKQVAISEMASCF